VDRTSPPSSASPGVTTRRATAGDFDAVRRVYDIWAAAQNGPLTRRGVSFTADAEEFVAAFTGVTLAVDEHDEVVGYANWHRGTGYDASATTEVSDLLALSVGGYRALWRGARHVLPGHRAGTPGHLRRRRRPPVRRRRGPDPRRGGDAALDALLGGRRVHIRDYF
jgi:hypothetical protein